MIRDNQVNAPGGSGLGRFHVNDAAINRYDEVGAGISDCIDSFDMNAKTLIVPMRKVVCEVAVTGPAEKIGKKSGSWYAVCVVVAVYDDLFSRTDCSYDPVNRLAHILHEEWVVTVTHIIRIKKGFPVPHVP
jgi:hypothetical protein